MRRIVFFVITISVLLTNQIAMGEIAKVSSLSATGVTLYLAPGTYIASPEDGAWRAWADSNTGCLPNCWLYNYTISSSQFSDIGHSCGRHPSESQALAAAHDVIFTVSTTGAVRFWIKDSPYSDNRGSISLKIEKLNEVNFGPPCS